MALTIRAADWNREDAMDKTPYSDYLLCMQTLRLCRRIMRNNPELWEQICREAAQAEAEAASASAEGAEV